MDNDQEVSFTGVLIVIAFFICIGYPIEQWMRKKDEDGQKVFVTSIMKDACAKECADHGVTWEDLKGPNFESYDNFHRGYGSYQYSWQVQNKPLSVIVRVHWRGDKEDRKVIWKNQ